MSNELALRLWIGKSLRKHSSRFIASGLPAGQDAKGQEDLLILPSCIAAQRRSSRSSALLYAKRPLSDWIVSSSFIRKRWAHFCY